MHSTLRVSVCLPLFSVVAVALTLSAVAPTGTAATYPDDWWKPFPRDQAYDWEILPQDAAPGEVILSKRTELAIFSNFWATPFELDGVRYASVEGLWQMMKFPEGEGDPRAEVPGVTWPRTRAEVGQLVSFEAKEAGDFGSKVMKQLGINWVTYKGVQLPYRVPERGEHYKLIVRAMRAKLDQTPGLRDLLLKTGDLVLKADHKPSADAGPAWAYYEIWTELRASLRAELSRAAAVQTKRKG